MDKVCVDKVCVDKVCVDKVCVDKVLLEGGRRRRRRSPGYRIKNKNPTQRCGEKHRRKGRVRNNREKEEKREEDKIGKETRALQVPCGSETYGYSRENNG